jgi:lipid-binding SYLF domain-containing protein
MLTSRLKFGGDTSISVGPVGAGAKANVVADILSFSRSRGAFAGLSLEGAVVSVRDEWNSNFYGKPVRPVDILVKNTVSNPGSAGLREAVAKAAKK